MPTAPPRYPSEPDTPRSHRSVGILTSAVVLGVIGGGLYAGSQQVANSYARHAANSYVDDEEALPFEIGGYTLYGGSLIAGILGASEGARAFLVAEW